MTHPFSIPHSRIPGAMPCPSHCAWSPFLQRSDGIRSHKPTFASVYASVSDSQSSGAPTRDRFPESHTVSCDNIAPSSFPQPQQSCCVRIRFHLFRIPREKGSPSTYLFPQKFRSLSSFFCTALLHFHNSPPTNSLRIMQGSSCWL